MLRKLLSFLPLVYLEKILQRWSIFFMSKNKYCFSKRYRKYQNQIFYLARQVAILCLPARKNVINSKTKFNLSIFKIFSYNFFMFLLKNQNWKKFVRSIIIIFKITSKRKLFVSEVAVAIWNLATSYSTAPRRFHLYH